MAEEIADRVALVIKESGLDDDEIAILVDKSQSTVNRWRNKKTTNYPKSTLKLIAYALRVDYDWLRHGENSRQGDPKVQYADEVDLPANGKLSRDLYVKFLRQIESIARKLADNLEGKYLNRSSDEP